MSIFFGGVGWWWLDCNKTEGNVLLSWDLLTWTLVLECQWFDFININESAMATINFILRSFSVLIKYVHHTWDIIFNVIWKSVELNLVQCVSNSIVIKTLKSIKGIVSKSNGPKKESVCLGWEAWASELSHYFCEFYCNFQRSYCILICLIYFWFVFEINTQTISYALKALLILLNFVINYNHRLSKENNNQGEIWWKCYSPYFLITFFRPNDLFFHRFPVLASKI